MVNSCVLWKLLFIRNEIASGHRITRKCHKLGSRVPLVRFAAWFQMIIKLNVLLIYAKLYSISSANQKRGSLAGERKLIQHDLAPICHDKQNKSLAMFYLRHDFNWLQQAQAPSRSFKCNVTNCLSKQHLWMHLNNPIMRFHCAARHKANNVAYRQGFYLL